jgi:hypothetical protein
MAVLRISGMEDFPHGRVTIDHDVESRPRSARIDSARAIRGSPSRRSGVEPVRAGKLDVSGG